jgi:hypothetical protein
VSTIDTISVKNDASHIVDTLSIYNIMRLLLGSIIKNSITFRAVLVSTRKRMANIREPCGRPKLNILESSCQLLKEKASFWSAMKELV